MTTETAARKPSAQDKRFAAMRALGDAIVGTERNADGVLVQVWHVTDREQIAAAIRELAPLGRTDRWHAAVESWALLVLDTDNDMPWAFFQGSIWTGYAG